MGCLACVIGTLTMQGQATDSTASARHGSLAAHGHSRAGNESRINAPAGGSPLGGANRDELDDLLHLLEIDTTTRNCEHIPCSLLRVPQLFHPTNVDICLNGRRLHCVSVPVCVARACAYVRVCVRVCVRAYGRACDACARAYLGTLVDLRQQIAVEMVLRRRLRAEIQEMDTRTTMMQISVADSRRSDSRT